MEKIHTIIQGLTFFGGSSGRQALAAKKPLTVGRNRRHCDRCHELLRSRARGAADTDTDDFSRWLIAWIWHDPKSTDQLCAAVIELATQKLTNR
jgi:hypothetical protein